MEVIFEKKAGYFRETENDRIMEKVDADGNVPGFSVLKVSSLDLKRHSALGDAPGEVGVLDGSLHYQVHLPAKELPEVFLEAEVPVEEPGRVLRDEGHYEVQVTTAGVGAFPGRRAEEIQPPDAVALADLLQPGLTVFYQSAHDRNYTATA